MEVIYIPFDTTEESFNTYLKTIPWISIPYNDPRIPKFAENYNVKVIPVLIVLRPDLTILSDKAKYDVFRVLKE